MKDSTLYIVLCIIVASFCVFLGFKMIFPAKTKPIVQDEPVMKNTQEEEKNITKEEPIVNGIKNEVSSSGVIKQDNVFYSQIHTYEGTKKGNEVRNLLENIRNCNLVSDTKIQVEFEGKDRTSEVYEMKSEIETGKSYKIQFEYHDETKDISKVIIH